MIDYEILSTAMSVCDVSSDSSSNVSMHIPTIPFGVIAERELTSDEENDKGFASMPAKESLYEDSDSDNYNDSVNNNNVDAAIDFNLHKKPRAINVQTSDNNRTKGPSKRKSQVSIVEFMKSNKKAFSKGNNINIDISECNSAATDGLDNCSEATAAKIDSLIAIKQKELKSWEKMIVQKRKSIKYLKLYARALT